MGVAVVKWPESALRPLRRNGGYMSTELDSADSGVRGFHFLSCINKNFLFHPSILRLYEPQIVKTTGARASLGATLTSLGFNSKLEVSSTVQSEKIVH